MARHLIDDASLAFVEGTEKTDFDQLSQQVAALSEQVESIVAETTTNLSGETITVQYASVERSGSDTFVIANFNIPLNAVIVEASYALGASTTYQTEGVSIHQEDGFVVVKVDNFDDTSGVVKLVYSNKEAVEIPELTDIRVGFDGTEYGTAGAAVRNQLEQLSRFVPLDVSFVTDSQDVTQCDSTNQEIYNAYRAGKLVRATVRATYILMLTRCSSDLAQFAGVADYDGDVVIVVAELDRNVPNIRITVPTGGAVDANEVDY